MLKIRTLVGLVVFGLIFSIGFMAEAKTPDGETPAVETCCDPLSGAQYGLCNAFCEAQDCDDLYPDLTNSCYKLLSNFLKHSDAAGPPCVCEEICGDNFEACQAPCFDTRQKCVADCPTSPPSDRNRCRKECASAFNTCNEPCVESGRQCREGCCEQIGEVFIPGTGCVLPCNERAECGGECIDDSGDRGQCESNNAIVSDCTCQTKPPTCERGLSCGQVCGSGGNGQNYYCQSDDDGNRCPVCAPITIPPMSCDEPGACDEDECDPADCEGTHPDCFCED